MGQFGVLGDTIAEALFQAERYEGCIEKLGGWTKSDRAKYWAAISHYELNNYEKAVASRCGGFMVLVGLGDFSRYCEAVVGSYLKLGNYKHGLTVLHEMRIHVHASKDYRGKSGLNGYNRDLKVLEQWQEKLEQAREEAILVNPPEGPDPFPGN